MKDNGNDADVFISGELKKTQHEQSRVAMSRLKTKDDDADLSERLERISIKSPTEEEEDKSSNSVKVRFVIAKDKKAVDDVYFVPVDCIFAYNPDDEDHVKAIKTHFEAVERGAIKKKLSLEVVELEGTCINVPTVIGGLTPKYKSKMIGLPAKVKRKPKTKKECPACGYVDCSEPACSASASEASASEASGSEASSSAKTYKEFDFGASLKKK